MHRTSACCPLFSTESIARCFDRPKPSAIFKPAGFRWPGERCTLTPTGVESRSFAPGRLQRGLTDVLAICAASGIRDSCLDERVVAFTALAAGAALLR